MTHSSCTRRPSHLYLSSKQVVSITNQRQLYDDPASLRLASPSRLPVLLTVFNLPRRRTYTSTSLPTYPLTPQAHLNPPRPRPPTPLQHQLPPRKPPHRIITAPNPAPSPHPPTQAPLHPYPHPSSSYTAPASPPPGLLRLCSCGPSPLVLDHPVAFQFLRWSTRVVPTARALRSVKVQKVARVGNSKARRLRGVRGRSIRLRTKVSRQQRPLPSHFSLPIGGELGFWIQKGGISINE